MTTIVAVKKGKRVCLACDTLSIFGSRKEIMGSQVCGKGKILQIGENYIAAAGHHSWDLALSHYFSKNKNQMKWNTAEQIFEVFTVMHHKLKNNYYLIPPNLDFLAFESSEYELLLINPHGIFEVEYSRTVRQYSRFSAIGTGEDYALGSIQSVYSQVKDPKEIAKIAIEAAAQFDRKTELPICIECIEFA